MVLVNAYSMMLPRLQAEEALNASGTIGLAIGNLPRITARGLLASLKRQARGLFQRREKRQPPNPAALAAMGVTVVNAPAKDHHDG